MSAILITPRDQMELLDRATPFQIEVDQVADGWIISRADASASKVEVLAKFEAANGALQRRAVAHAAVTFAEAADAPISASSLSMREHCAKACRDRGISFEHEEG